MNETERVDGTKLRLSKPGADSRMEEIGEGRTRRMVRKVSVDTLHGRIRRNRLSKPAESAAGELVRLHTLARKSLSTVKYERSSPGSDEMSQRAADALAELGKIRKDRITRHYAPVYDGLLLDDWTLVQVGLWGFPDLKDRATLEAHGDDIIGIAFDALAEYFGFETKKDSGRGQKRS